MKTSHGDSCCQNGILGMKCGERCGCIRRKFIKFRGSHAIVSLYYTFRHANGVDAVEVVCQRLNVVWMCEPNGYA